jgi:CO/xanthine dehydrogenase Mo-binding subunit
MVKVVIRGNFVGLVAEKPWQALQAAAAVKVTWKNSVALPSFPEFHERLRALQPTRDTLLVDSGDVNAQLAAANSTVRATYRYPYQMHGSLGTSCAVADVRGNEATIWSATQAVYPLRSSMATVLGVPADGIRVIFRMASGCYGVNGADTVSYDAALLSQAVGKPVRVQLTRKDEMAWENFGPAFVIDQRAGLDAKGNITVWDHESWTLTMGGRPGANAPGNVVTGFLAGFQPNAFAARSPAPAPTNFANGSNAVPSYVTGCVGARCGGTGKVSSQRVLTHTVRSPFFTGPLRSPERLQNTFAHESFMDELATAAGVDPVEFRVRHLADPRLIEVVRSAARASGWQTRRAASAARTTGVASGQGIATVLYEGDNGYCALVAEVDVHTDSGEIRVKRFVIANDSGPVSNPDGLRNQLEGGALHGLSRTLTEEVTWDETWVTSVDWRSYRPLFLGSGIPKIETVLINRPDERAMGAGETAVTLVAAAVGNAVFDATGVRLRQVPFTPARVKTALSSRK